MARPLTVGGRHPTRWIMAPEKAAFLAGYPFWVLALAVAPPIASGILGGLRSGHWTAQRPVPVYCRNDFS